MFTIPSRLARSLAVVATAAAVTLGSSGRMAAADTSSSTQSVVLAIPGVVSFTAAIPPQLAGGGWTLTTSTLSPVSGVYLGSGQLAADQIALATSLTAAVAIIPGGSNQFNLIIMKPIDSAHGYVGIYTTGVTPARITSGIVVPANLLVRQVSFVTSVPSPVSVVPQQATSTSVTSGGGTNVMARIMPILDPGQVIPPAPKPPSVPRPNCADLNACGVATPGTPNPSCGPTFSGTDCIVDSQDIHGVLTTRGFATAVVGADATFKVESSNTDKMDSGTRLGVGPFSVSGSAEISQQLGTDDTWPTNGWCYADENTDPNCMNVDGNTEAQGNDSWRWEKHITTYCGGFEGLSCTSSTYEVLYDRGYDGGTLTGNTDLTYYYAFPSNITAGQHGAWAPYTPRSISTTYMKRTQALSAAAEVSVTAPDSFGTTTFNAGATWETVSKKTNEVHLKNDEPFYSEWYRYDQGSNWQMEYWSCNWASGWSGGYGCWPMGY